MRFVSLLWLSNTHKRQLSSSRPLARTLNGATAATCECSQQVGATRNNSLYNNTKRAIHWGGSFCSLCLYTTLNASLSTTPELYSGILVFPPLFCFASGLAIFSPFLFATVGCPALRGPRNARGVMGCTLRFRPQVNPCLYTLHFPPYTQ